MSEKFVYMDMPIEEYVDAVQGMTYDGDVPMQYYFADNGRTADGNALLLRVDEIGAENAEALCQRGGRIVEGYAVSYPRDPHSGEYIPPNGLWTGWQSTGDLFVVQQPFVWFSRHPQQCWQYCLCPCWL